MMLPPPNIPWWQRDQILNVDVGAAMQPGTNSTSEWDWPKKFGDEGFRKALGEAWSGAGAGYQAADTPFSLSGSAGGGQQMQRPQPLQMQGMGSLFGGYNPYIDRRKK